MSASATQKATDNFILSSGLVDYYSLLNVEDKATSAEIKAAYRALAKVCHVDVAGDDAHDTCILLNEAYTVLSDPEKRSLYNRELDQALALEDDGFTGEPLSKWMVNTKMGKNEDPEENRAVFVDEVACIGCRECIYAAAATFRIEEDYGRSRVFAQWVSTEEQIQTAMDCCPVSCIHWVDRQDLPALEYVVRNKLKRPTVAAMMAGQGGYVPDVWAATAKYLKERQALEEARARAAAASKFSTAQEVARRAAAEGVASRQMGWFRDAMGRVGLSSVADSIAASMDQVATSTMGSVLGSMDDGGEYAQYRMVGRRKRGKQAVDGVFGARGMNGGKVPLERALVLAASTKQPWHSH